MPMFLPKIFIVLTLIFRSRLLFEADFCEWCELGVVFIFSHDEGYLVAPAPFVDKWILFPLNEFWVQATVVPKPALLFPFPFAAAFPCVLGHNFLFSSWPQLWLTSVASSSLPLCLSFSLCKKKFPSPNLVALCFLLSLHHVWWHFSALTFLELLVLVFPWKPWRQDLITSFKQSPQWWVLVCTD